MIASEDFLKQNKYMISPFQLVYILISLAYIVVSLLNLIESYKVYVYWLMLIYFLLFAITLCKRNFSLYQVYLITFFVFLLARVFLDCINVNDMKIFDLYENAYMSESLAVDTLRVVGCFLIATSYAWLCVDSKIDFNTFSKGKYFNYKASNKINVFLNIGFITFAVLAFIKAAWLVLIIVGNGYGVLFNNSIEMKFPVILNGAVAIFYIFYAIVLYYNRDEKKFKRFTSVYIIISITRLFGGARASFFCNMLFVLYMWSTYYKEIRILSLKIIAAVVAFPILAESISIFRFRQQLSIINLIKNNVFFSVMRGQGISLTVVANTIKHLDDFQNKVPFLLGYFTDFFQSEPAGQVIEDIEYGNYLGDHLTYMINPTRFLSGSGTGTSLVAEVYELTDGSLALLIILTFLIFYLLLKFCSDPYSSLPRFCICYFLTIDIIFSPRGSVCTSLDYIAVSLLASVIIRLFENHKYFYEPQISQKKDAIKKIKIKMKMLKWG